MIVKDVEVTILKTDLKQGVGKKSGKDYKFYTTTVIDEDANVFNLSLSDDFVKGLGDEKLELLIAEKNYPAKVDIKFAPKGFDIGGTVQAIRE